MRRATIGAWHRPRSAHPRSAWHLFGHRPRSAWHLLGSAWHHLIGAWHSAPRSAWHRPGSAWHPFQQHRFHRCLAPLAWCAWIFLTQPSWAAEPPPEEPPPTVRSVTQRLSWAQVIDVVLPGVVLDIAPWPTNQETDPSSASGLAVLLRPEDGEDDGPRHLYRLRGTADDLRPVATDLPSTADTLLRHSEQLWIGDEGRILRYQEDQGLTTLLELEGLSLGSLVTRGLISEERVLIPEVGKVRQYTADLRPTDEGFPLPVEARRRPGRLELWSPPIRRHGDALHRFVTDPIALDAHRLRVTSIDLEAEGEDRLQDSWLRFAGPEDVEQSHFVHIDGRPALIVATTRGDKLGIFEKLELRTFLLKPDRTHAGRLPRNSLQTATRNWYEVEPRIVDFDADGKDDLLLIQPQGLGADELLVELHPGRGGGLLEPRGRRSKLKVEGSSWDMSSDFTGDGTVDLLLMAEGELRIYTGIARHKKRVVDDTPRHLLGPAVSGDTDLQVAINVSAQGSESEAIGFHRPPRLLQLDGDPRPEIVLMETVRRRSVLRLVDLVDP